ncbi:MAG: hypothetical protein ACM31D_08290 [Bacteroidota bacterium]
MTVWQGPCLLTPLTVEALLVGSPNRTSDWAGLQVAYQNLRVGGNPTPQPFQTLAPNDVPGTGAHVMAVLPKGLRHAVTTGAETTFHPIPNRWLVVRFLSKAGAAPSIKIWVLQSDYTGDQGTNPWPGDPADQNSTFIGRSYVLENWTESGGPAQPILRATAPGSLDWLACYANIGNVMGFYDSLADVSSGTLSYGMFGWYQPAQFDPLLGVDASHPNGFMDQATWSDLMQSLSLLVSGGSVGLEAAQAAWAEWLHDHPNVNDSGLPEAQQNLAAQVVCHGFVYGLNWTGPAIAYPRAPILSSHQAVEIAVGGTGIEAISAWLADQMGNSQAEELLQALGDSMVFTYAQDPVEFEEENLSRRFSSTTGQLVWVVSMANGTQPNSQRAVQEVPLTPEQTAALTSLNAVQAQLDAATAAYDSALWQLFALVWKNNNDISGDYDSLIAAAVQELDALESQIQTSTSQRDADLSTLRGLLSDDYQLSNIPASRFFRGMAPSVLVAGAVPSTAYLQPESLPCRFTGQSLVGLNVVDAANGLPNLTEVTATQMCAACTAAMPSLFAALNSAPVPKETLDMLGEWMLLDTGNANWIATLLYANAGVTNYTPQQLAGLTATVGKLQNITQNSSVAGVLDAELIGAAAGFVGVMPPALCALPYAPAWVPLYIDWRTQWASSAKNAQDVLKDWVFKGLEYDWVAKDVPAFSDTYTGRSLLNTAVAGQFAAALTAFVNSPACATLPAYQASLLQQAAQLMPKFDLITQRLDGHEDYFITRSAQTTCLSYTNGPEDLQKKVNAYLEECPNSVVPAPGFDGFYPLRAGHLQLETLWVVDAFGQILNPSPTGVVLPIRSKSVTTPPVGQEQNQSLIQLAPRIEDAMRLNLLALDATDDSIPSNSSSATSAIAGWLLPNHLDNSLQVFDDQGTALGEVIPVVNDKGQGLRWDPAPGVNLPLGAAPNIANPHVAAFVQNLLLTQLTSGNQALTELLSVIDTSMWATAPRGQPVDMATAALVGCPLAIVRASVQLQSLGDLPRDQRWKSAGGDGGLSQTPIPTYVGDLSLGTNGVLGFFLDDDYSLLRPARGYGNGEAPVTALRRRLSSTPMGEGAPVSPSGYVSSDPVFDLLPAGSARMLTIIMDPRGWLTALNGLMPVVDVGLMPGPVSAAINNLDATFRIGPILWDSVNPDLPLPAISQAQWDWVARTEVSVWETRAHLSKSNTKTVIPPTPLALREGWLRLSDFTK